MERKGTHWVGPIAWSRKSLANGQPWTKWGGKKTIGMEHYDLILRESILQKGITCSRRKGNSIDNPSKIIKLVHW